MLKKKPKNQWTKHPPQRLEKLKPKESRKKRK